ncbi:hypothetical protein PVAP13_5KG466421 [Panicum virgatum]|uniref:Uncharacterized protein n=1 Tax=Panicum virgatum TaxID=38727 RepID=A0A8T0STG1_PANVG|nr:hypothetical protein PVAP13_5KG466421 [Panicum virgatum]
MASLSPHRSSPRRPLPPPCPRRPPAHFLLPRRRPQPPPSPAPLLVQPLLPSPLHCPSPSLLVPSCSDEAGIQGPSPYPWRGGGGPRGRAVKARHGRSAFVSAEEQGPAMAAARGRPPSPSSLSLSLSPCSHPRSLRRPPSLPAPPPAVAPSLPARPPALASPSPPPTRTTEVGAGAARAARALVLLSPSSSALLRSAALARPPLPTGSLLPAAAPSLCRRLTTLDGSGQRRRHRVAVWHQPRARAVSGTDRCSTRAGAAGGRRRCCPPPGAACSRSTDVDTSRAHGAGSPDVPPQRSEGGCDQGVDGGGRWAAPDGSTARTLMAVTTIVCPTHKEAVAL